MNPRDLYLALIDPTGRQQTTFTEHRVWDKETFINTRTKFYANHRNEDERRDVLEITKTQFDRKSI